MYLCVIVKDLVSLLYMLRVLKFEQLYFVIQKILYCSAGLTFRSEMHLSLKKPLCAKRRTSIQLPHIDSCLTLVRVKPDLRLG